MTVVPGLRPGTVQLICDGCGEIRTEVTSQLREPDVVWPVIAEYAWSGSAFATGPHRCPRCPTGPIDVPVVPPAGPVESAAWHVAIDSLPDAVVVRPSGDIDLAVAEPLRAALAEAVAVGRPVVLDLSQVELIDSTGLGILVRAHNDARQRGLTLCLVAPSRFVLTVLHTMRLAGVFLTFDERHQALTCLAAARAD
ncbi:anti-sigma factor antagonist [Micromonospora fluostatini]|uniref:Anti-sigma factor antagonist n=1 Tax=Micromonospora fluostatini TaxID=1629071 RepID=A0ABY2DI74_9ACTN|nr:anti-sigma factor antagonist [Micromonospora fluostatini]